MKSWRIAGGLGNGIGSTSQNVSKGWMRASLHVFTHWHYPSRIRSGHTYVEVRVSAEPMKLQCDGYNILLALGIRKPVEPGFKHIEIAPKLVDSLEWVEASTDTIRGEVSSQWVQTAEGLTLEVDIPDTATATIQIPDLGGDTVQVSESETVIWDQGEPERPFPSGIESVEREDDVVVVEVDSGRYEFTLNPTQLHAIGRRNDDGTIFTGGQTDQIDLSMTGTESVQLRDQIPDGWTVQAGDEHTVYEENGNRYIEFEATGQALEVTYFVEAPSGADQTGQYSFGPIEVTTGGSWETLSGTSETNLVVGADTNI